MRSGDKDDWKRHGEDTDGGGGGEGCSVTRKCTGRWGWALFALRKPKVELCNPSLKLRIFRHQNEPASCGTNSRWQRISHPELLVGASIFRAQARSFLWLPSRKGVSPNFIRSSCHRKYIHRSDFSTSGRDVDLDYSKSFNNYEAH